MDLEEIDQDELEVSEDNVHLPDAPREDQYRGGVSEFWTMSKKIHIPSTKRIIVFAKLSLNFNFNFG